MGNVTLKYSGLELTFPGNTDVNMSFLDDAVVIGDVTVSANGRAKSDPPPWLEDEAAELKVLDDLERTDGFITYSELHQRYGVSKRRISELANEHGFYRAGVTKPRMVKRKAHADPDGKRKRHNPSPVIAKNVRLMREAGMAYSDITAPLHVGCETISKACRNVRLPSRMAKAFTHEERARAKDLANRGVELVQIALQLRRAPLATWCMLNPDSMSRLTKEPLDKVAPKEAL